MAINVLVENNASGTLVAGITDSATTLSLHAGEGAEFPNPTGSEYFYATLQKSSGAWEIIKVTARSSDTFTTIVRNIASSTGSAQAFSTDDIVSLRPVAEIIEDIISAFNTHQTATDDHSMGTLAQQDADDVAITGGSAALDNEADDVAIKARDHGAATTPEVVNVIYGTSPTPPAANSVPLGTIYVQY